MGLKLLLLGWTAMLLVTNTVLASGSNTNAQIGQPCDTDSDCRLGASGLLSECHANKTCVCTDAAVFEPGETPNLICRQKAEFVEDVCKKDSQCTANLGELAYCGYWSNNIYHCYCRTQGAVSQDRRKCLPPVDLIGAPCEVDGECRNGLPGSESECESTAENPDQGTCQCKETAIHEPDGHVCYKKAIKLSERCEVNLQCTTNIGEYSECRSERCSCVPGAWGNFEGDPDTTCIPTVLNVGESCNDTAQCKGIPGKSSICATMCHCEDANIPSSRNDDCLVIRNVIGDNCTENQQCQQRIPGPLSVCLNGECHCSDDAVYQGRNHTCFKKATMVGDECVTQAQCYANLGHSICQSGECICNSLAVPAKEGDRCLLLEGLGGPCEQGQDQQCNHSEPNAECGNNGGTGWVCRCKDGYMPDPDNALEKCVGLEMIH